ncbi:TlyA family RNA methyltransferase [Agreia sp. COWG]|uniref:TlyA family RNA methyltransferase n=1 Tax=Agreia sp. COWG TaxID=2773266 RepID=UPI001926486E|nr:TlyA family RNA methyltransferase [Agreia sp. COWG]
MTDTRLDAAVAAVGLARSRNHAAQLIADGVVRVDGIAQVKASFRVREGQALSVDGDDGYVSRAAGKLVAALDAFPSVVVDGRLALDAGASTGGFSQVLLERGARQVIALDVGHGQLAPIIAGDPRVSVVEGFNVRFATAEKVAAAARVDESPSLVVGDLSFISLITVLPALQQVATPDADFVLLVKPQFEVGRTGIKEGIVKNAGLRGEAVSAVLWSAHDLGLGTVGVAPSPVIGTAGNKEYLIHLSATVGTNPTQWLDAVTRMTGV